MTAVLPDPGIEVEICLGVGRTDTAAVWDTGRFDVNTWTTSDTSLGDWVDVSCSVLDGVDMTAGASNDDGVVTRWEAATCSFTLVGYQWNPNSGPYAGLLAPNLPVRVRWRPVGSDTWMTAFLGAVGDSGFAYTHKGNRPRATVAATDGTRILAAFDGVEQSPAGYGETAAQRVTRIADNAGWPLNLRDITPGGVAVKETTLAGVAWTELLAVADTDLALLWVTRDGRLAYRPQGKVTPQRQLTAVIQCGAPVKAGPVEIVPATRERAGETTVTPMDITGQQPTITRNVVSISRQKSEVAGTEPATFTARDETSVSRFFTHAYSRTDLLHTDDAWNQKVADAVLASSAWPTTAPNMVALDSRADYDATAVLLMLEPSISIGVSDGVDTWQCEPAGWKVTLSRARVYGEITLTDVSRWFGSEWDGAQWDIDKWGF